MALKTKVKAGNITNLSDARYCSGMGVDLIGFPIGSEHLEADTKRYRDIRSWISGPAIVLEWGDAPIPAEFLNDLHSYNADFLEIGVRQLENLPSVAVPLLVRFRLEESQLLESVIAQKQPEIKYLLLACDELSDSVKEKINSVAGRFDVLLKINSPDSDLEAILALNIKGIVLSGSTEVKPGLKDYTSLSEVLERLDV